MRLRPPTPRAFSLGLSIGICLGLIPVNFLVTPLLVALVLTLNVSLIGAIAGGVIGFGLQHLFEPQLHHIGLWVLTLPGLQPIWTTLYNLPVLPLSHFYNTVVCGSLFVAGILTVPLYAAGTVIFSKLSLFRTADASRRLIRLPVIAGVGIALILGLGFNIFFLDNLSKIALTRAGESVFGAKVEIGESRILWRPFGIELMAVKVADQDDPMQNLFEFQSLRATLRFVPLLSEKIVVDNLDITDIELMTPRRSSGALPAGTFKKRERWFKTPDFNLALPKLDLADLQKSLSLDRVIATSNLLLQNRFDSIKTNISGTGDKWRQFYSAAPFKSQLTSLQSRLTGLPQLKKVESPDDILALKQNLSQVVSLVKDIQALRQSVSSQFQQFKSEFSSIQSTISNLDTVAQQDIRQIVQSVSPEGGAIDHLSNFIFGDSMTDKAKRMLFYLAQMRDNIPAPDAGTTLKASLVRSGMDISFPKQNTLPKFWIKDIELSAKGKKHQIVLGEGTHFSSNPSFINKPFKLAASGQNFIRKGTKGTINVIADARSAQGLYATNGYFEGFQIPEFPIWKKAAVLKSARASGGMDVKLNGQAINGTLKLTLSNFSIQTQPAIKGAVSIPEIASKALANTSKIDISALISGDILTPNITIKTNVDGLLKASIASAIDSIVAVRLAPIKSKINALNQSFQSQLRSQVGQHRSVIEGQFKQDQAALGQLTTQISEIQKRIEKDLKKGLPDGAKGIEVPEPLQKLFNNFR